MIIEVLLGRHLLLPALSDIAIHFSADQFSMFINILAIIFKSRGRSTVSSRRSSSISVSIVIRFDLLGIIWIGVIDVFIVILEQLFEFLDGCVVKANLSLEVILELRMCILFPLASILLLLQVLALVYHGVHLNDGVVLLEDQLLQTLDFLVDLDHLMHMLGVDHKDGALQCRDLRLLQLKLFLDAIKQLHQD